MNTTNGSNRMALAAEARRLIDETVAAAAREAFMPGGFVATRNKLYAAIDALASAPAAEPVAFDRDLHSHMMIVATRAADEARSGSGLSGGPTRKEILRTVCRAIAADKNLRAKLAASPQPPISPPVEPFGWVHELPDHEGKLKAIYERLLEGDFYDDYDRAIEMVGWLQDMLAASPQPISPPVEQAESGWLIEHSGELPGVTRPMIGWLYVAETSHGKKDLRFTHDASEALRFARREDAEAVLAMHLGPNPPDWYKKPYSVTEHMWPGAVPSSQAPQQPPAAQALAEAERLISLRRNVGNAAYEAQCEEWLGALRAQPQAAEKVVAQWQPIETAPKDGEFLVYMPEERTKFQVARFHQNVKIIGNTFAFDLTEPTHWMPLPASPTTQADPGEGEMA
jgi:hypothetical protein